MVLIILAGPYIMTLICMNMIWLAYAWCSICLNEIWLAGACAAWTVDVISREVMHRNHNAAQQCVTSPHSKGTGSTSFENSDAFCSATVTHYSKTWSRREEVIEIEAKEEFTVVLLSTALENKGMKVDAEVATHRIVKLAAVYADVGKATTYSHFKYAKSYT